MRSRLCAVIVVAAIGAAPRAAGQASEPRLPQDFDRLTREFAEYVGARRIAALCPGLMPDGIVTPIDAALAFYAANIRRRQMARGASRDRVDRALAALVARAEEAVAREVATAGCESERVARSVAFVRGEFQRLVEPEGANEGPAPRESRAPAGRADGGAQTE